MSFLQKLNTLLRLGLIFERNSSVYTARNTIVLERFLVTPPATIIEHFTLCGVNGELQSSGSGAEMSVYI